ncbi:hypothetical protein BAOM_0573 [Peribacillus asahii]|uniref:Uncharacterized protein n=1 Tax=Peribacillus asahii TaxID=228899 RepID=A0A3Q9RKE0_9BACI|nr:hypothetical protein BAOM_0573 [Peribacillus asahii]
MGIYDSFLDCYRLYNLYLNHNHKLDCKFLNKGLTKKDEREGKL